MNYTRKQNPILLGYTTNESLIIREKNMRDLKIYLDNSSTLSH